MSVRKDAVDALIGTGAFGVDRERFEQVIDLYLTIRRLAKKHHRLAEMDCNGEGWLKGRHYYAGQIDEQNSGSVSAYVADDVTVFQQESDKVEAKITALVAKLGTGWRVEFQGDPRGNTVKLFVGDRFVELA